MSTFVQVPGGPRLRTLVRQAGAEERVLLIHGLASNARLWDGVAEHLAAASIGSVAVDLRGHGESDRPDDGYDFSTIAADLEAVVAEFGGTWKVAGQSWGGNVAVELAARARFDLTGVVLVDGGFIRLADDYPDVTVAQEQLRPPDFTGWTRDRLASVFEELHPDWPPAGVAGQLANFEDAAGGTIRPRLRLDQHLAILRELHRQDPDLLAERIEVPVTVIAVGEPRSRARVEAFASRLRSGHVVWTDGHHDVHAQRPSFVAELIRGVR